MKTKTFISKVVLSTILFLSVCGMASAGINAAGDDNFINNDVTKDGKVISREIYKQDQSTGTLSPIRKYEYEYDALQQLTKKIAYDWNSIETKWEKASLLSITRNLSETSIEMAEWVNKKQGFSPTSKFVYVTNPEKKLVTQYTYKMNKRTKEWELQKSTQSSKVPEIYANTK